MGKFNFISGGYYGKLGNTVGQRWKNQRIVHEYFIPANPRTEIQQDNRERFIDITGATQLALQLNGGSRLWDSLTNTAFNNRQAEAARYAEQGGGGFSYVPVIPYGYEAPHYFEPMPAYEDGVLTWTSTDMSHLAGRQMAIALHLQNRSNSRYENMIFRTLISGSAGAWTFSVTVPSTHRLNSETWQIGVNCDDGEEELETIYVAPMSLANLKQKIALTLNSLSVTWDNTTSTYSGTISTSPLIDGDATPLLNASLSGILLGEQSTQSTVIQTRNSAGGLSFTFTPNRDALNQRILFPSGSTCTIPAATFQSSDKIYITQPTTLNFSAALETQNWSSIPLTATQSADNKIAVSAPIAGASSVSGTMGFSLTSYDSTLSAQSVAASLSGTVAANAIAFQTSAAVAQIVNKDAQTVALTSRPTFVKNGVTYQLNNAQTVTMAQGSTLFTASISSITVFVSVNNAKATFEVELSQSFPSAWTASGVIKAKGVIQMNYDEITENKTLTLSENTITFDMSLNTDDFNQVTRFPEESTVTFNTFTWVYSGYTFSITGGTYNVAENIVPAQLINDPISIDYNSNIPRILATKYNKGEISRDGYYFIIARARSATIGTRFSYSQLSYNSTTDNNRIYTNTNLANWNFVDSSDGVLIYRNTPTQIKWANVIWQAGKKEWCSGISLITPSTEPTLYASSYTLEDGILTLNFNLTSGTITITDISSELTSEATKLYPKVTSMPSAYYDETPTNYYLYSQVDTENNIFQIILEIYNNNIVSALQEGEPIAISMPNSKISFNIEATTYFTSHNALFEYQWARLSR